MKCPIDQTEMEKVSIWVGGSSSFGITALPLYIWIGDPKSGKEEERRKDLNAYKCPKCGKVELKVEEKTNE